MLLMVLEQGQVWV
jgi:hypothetical protein